jgi:ubiquinone/menaquinone biosynthesis C-methylase UbiE
MEPQRSAPEVSAMPLGSAGKVRVVGAERLESAPPAQAERNLRDLVRINRWFGGHRVALRVLRTLVSPAEHFSLLDVGAASGDIGRAIRAKHRNATVVSLDRCPAHLRTAEPPTVAADAFALPFLEGSFDYVMCSLFLHHFSDSAAVLLLRELRRFARRALLVLDLERHPVPCAFLPLTRHLLRWSELTVHDGCLSVAAGFTPAELAQIAAQAGAEAVEVRRHRPWFRLSMVVTPATGN